MLDNKQQNCEGGKRIYILKIDTSTEQIKKGRKN